MEAQKLAVIQHLKVFIDYRSAKESLEIAVQDIADKYTLPGINYRIRWKPEVDTRKYYNILQGDE